MIYFCKKIKSDTYNLKYFIAEALRSISELVNDEDELFDIKLILNELLVNGIIHGNNSDINKDVELSICVKEDCLNIVVRDEGKGVDRVNRDPKELRCYGRGLLIVESLADDMKINGCEISVYKNLC